MGARHFLELSFQIAKSGFKLKNEGTYLGVFWYLLSPTLMFALLFLVFSDRLGGNIPQYPLYLFLGLIIFNFYQKTTLESTRIVRTDYKKIIKSVNFPKESLVLGVVLKNLYSHVFEIILFLMLLVFLGSGFLNIIFYPFILLFFLIFIFGISLILCSVTAYFIDMENIWAFFSRLLWLATPIFYEIGGQTGLFYANLFNPLYYFIDVSRSLVVYNSFPELWMLLVAVFYSLISLFLGVLIFNKLKFRFAELI
jgi:ABC-type polysaccharide/polyol phosphate export permease